MKPKVTWIQWPLIRKFNSQTLNNMYIMQITMFTMIAVYSHTIAWTLKEFTTCSNTSAKQMPLEKCNSKNEYSMVIMNMRIFSYYIKHIIYVSTH